MQLSTHVDRNSDPLLICQIQNILLINSDQAQQFRYARAWFLADEYLGHNYMQPKKV